MKMEQGNRRVQYLSACAVSLAVITAGISFTWSAPVLPKFHDNQTGINLTDQELSWVVAIGSPGFMVGSLVTRYTSDGYGRKATILASAMPFAVGTIFMVTATQAWMMYIARFLWGLGTGMTGTVGIMYLAEIADKDIRGRLSMCTRFMMSFGSFLVMSVGPFVSFQMLNNMLLVLPITYFAACWWIPETPYYLLRNGKVDAARKELTKLSGLKDEAIVEERLMSMRSDVRNTMHRSSSIKELFTGKRYRRALIIIIGLRLTQIMSGSNTIQQYMGRITQESNAGMDLSTALIIFGAVRFVVGVTSSMLVDRLGRRILLIMSYLGTAVTLGIIGAYFYIQEFVGFDENTSKSYSIVAYVGIIAATVLSALGFDSVVHVIQAEIFPMNVKSVAMTFLNIFSGMMNFLTVKSYQNVKDVTGLCGVFWFFGIFSLAGSIFTYFMLPETKGKSLKEVQILLQGDAYEEDEKLNNGVVDNLKEEMRELKDIGRKEG